jgi:hypothetical protein
VGEHAAAQQQYWEWMKAELDDHHSRVESSLFDIGRFMAAQSAAAQASAGALQNISRLIEAHLTWSDQGSATMFRWPLWRTFLC